MTQALNHNDFNDTKSCCLPKGTRFRCFSLGYQELRTFIHQTHLVFGAFWWVVNLSLICTQHSYTLVWFKYLREIYLWLNKLIHIFWMYISIKKKISNLELKKDKKREQKCKSWTSWSRRRIWPSVTTIMGCRRVSWLVKLVNQRKSWSFLCDRSKCDHNQVRARNNPWAKILSGHPTLNPI